MNWRLAPVRRSFRRVIEGKLTAADLRAWKGIRPLPALTAYDYPTTRLLDEAGVPLILVGDSLGMVVLGHPDTTHVTLADMEHHVRAAARARPKALLVADLPINTYRNAAEAVASARRLTQAGAEAVKAEGGRDICEQVRAIVATGIPLLGHLGMLPQRVLAEGGYHLKGKRESERDALLADADFLAEAGAFAVVLELVNPPVAGEITRRVKIPTIGIGSGLDCDGQILVFNDLVGTFPWFTPRFVKPRLQAFAEMKIAIRSWMATLGCAPPVDLRGVGQRS